MLSRARVVVDATCGNGHDTLFLASRLEPGAVLLGFDLQRAAVSATRARLENAGIGSNVLLFARCHSALPEVLAENGLDRIDAAIFNLGYLPGGDHRTTTLPDSTGAALLAVLDILSPKGRVAVVAYRGHPGGELETTLVEHLWRRIGSGGFTVRRTASPGNGPVLFTALRHET